MKKKTKSAAVEPTAKVSATAVVRRPEKTSSTPPLPTASTTTTTIVAQIDVGFGNALFLRGDGPGLSWERGVPLACIADDRWSVALEGATRPVVFKFLLNDLTWCTGDDFVAQPGSRVTLVPTF